MALAWTDAAKNLIKSAYPAEQHNVGATAKASLIYAAFVTVVIYFILAVSSKVAKVAENHIHSIHFKTRPRPFVRGTIHRRETALKLK